MFNTLYGFSRDLVSCGWQKIQGPVTEGADIFFKKVKASATVGYEYSRHIVAETVPHALVSISDKVSVVANKEVLVASANSLASIAGGAWSMIFDASITSKVHERIRYKVIRIAQEGNLDELRKCLDEGISDGEAGILLRGSANKNDLDAVRMILESGKNIPKEYIYDALFYASSEGYLDVAQEILRKGKNFSVEELVGSKTAKAPLLIVCKETTFVPLVTKALELDSDCLVDNPEFLSRLFGILVFLNFEKPKVDEFATLVFSELQKERNGAPRRYSNNELFEMYKILLEA
jgi:hypothetical protein